MKPCRILILVLFLFLALPAFAIEVLGIERYYDPELLYDRYEMNNKEHLNLLEIRQRTPSNLLDRKVKEVIQATLVGVNTFLLDKKLNGVESWRLHCVYYDNALERRPDIKLVSVCYVRNIQVAVMAFFEGGEKNRVRLQYLLQEKYGEPLDKGITANAGLVNWDGIRKDGVVWSKKGWFYINPLFVILQKNPFDAGYPVSGTFSIVYIRGQGMLRVNEAIEESIRDEADNL